MVPGAFQLATTTQNLKKVRFVDHGQAAKPSKVRILVCFLCFFLQLRAATIEFIAQTEALQQYQTVDILWYCRTILLSYNNMSHIMHCHSIQYVSLKKHFYKDFTKLQCRYHPAFPSRSLRCPISTLPRRPGHL